MNGQKINIALAIQNEPIPVLPPGTSYLLLILYDEKLDFKQLAQELERFPSIAARILSVANSVWSSPVSPITSLPDACIRLGLQLVRSLSIALTVANVFNPCKCPAFDSERYWTTAILAAEGATLLAEKLNQPDQALTWRCAALFHNIGLLYLADRKPHETGEALLREEEISLTAAMREVLGIDYCEAGAWLIEAWELPVIFSKIVEYHKNPERTEEFVLATASIGIAASFASSLYQEKLWAKEAIPLGETIVLSPEKAEFIYYNLASKLPGIQKLAQSIMGGMYSRSG